jgi:hypothetical protein
MSFRKASLIHLLVNGTGNVEITFSAVDSSELVATAIGEALRSVPYCLRPIDFEKLQALASSCYTLRRQTELDSRVQFNTAWSVDENMTPITLFGA